MDEIYIGFMIYLVCYVDVLVIFRKYKKEILKDYRMIEIC